VSGLAGVNLHYIDSMDQAMEFKRWLGQRRPRPVLGLDTETSGLNPYERGANVRLIQFGDGEHGWAMSWELWKGLAIEAMEEWQGDWAGHNIASFDVRWIEAHSSFRFKRHTIRDGMIAAHIIDPLGPGALKRLAGQIIDPRAGGGQRLLDDAMAKNKWTWATVPTDFKPYWAYGALDPVLSYKLDLAFAGQVGPGARYAEIFDLEMAARHVVTSMQQRGARINRDYVSRTGEQQAEYASALMSWCRTHYGVSMRQNRALVKLFEDLGETITVFSEKTGGKSVDKYQMEVFTHSEVPGVAQLAQAVLDMRRASRNATSYLNALEENSIYGPDGYTVHADIRTLAARTSRMSISKPPLQQIPKRDALIREAFIAREGRKLVPVDYSQIEMRLLAHFSGDRDLQNAFLEADATGGDFFVIMGREIYREPGFLKSDKRRGLVKNTMYGKAYGAGIGKMAESAGVPYSQMEPVVHAVDARYPGIRRFMKSIEDVGMRRLRSEGQGYVMTPYGRKLPCDDDKIYALTNYLHQGHAAEIFKRSLIDLDMAGWGDYMVLPVHDEILLDVPEELVEEAMNSVPKVMSNMADYVVPLTAEAEGPFDNWGQKYA
jgi:DNA polymerase I-like protein with 3'-5' exonuclease and polymerase domains